MDWPDRTRAPRAGRVGGGLGLGRVAEAWRTFREAARRRVRVTRKGRALSLKASGQPGHIDLVEVRAGETYVRGWTTGRRVTLRTEMQTVTFTPTERREDVARAAQGARGFEGRLAGIDFLEVSIGTHQAIRIRTRGLRGTALAWARLCPVMLRIVVLHAPDWWGYLTRGDGGAATRLERILVPPPPAPDVPRAAPGLFPGPDDAPVARPTAPVDIVVPVYDAHDDLVVCLDRLRRHTEARHRIWLVDDASPDPRIAPLLDAFAADRPAARVIRCETNGGFVAAANLGLARARSHAVLLNTDAFVSRGWLDRLLHPILTDPSVASVTPLTTDGEIASAPRQCERTDPPPAVVAAMERAAARLGAGRALADAPTGVGFCMAMSADWLRQVPGFDPTFGRGYGEEVDWCRRTAHMGARHVVTGAVFVRHRGGGSFGPEKAERVKRNNRIVSRRYPGYDAAVRAFQEDDPLVGPRLALDLAAAGAEMVARGAGPLRVYLGHHLKGGAEQWLREEVAARLEAGVHSVVVRDGISTDHALIELHRAEGPMGTARTTRVDVPLADLRAYLRMPPRRELVYSCVVGARSPLDLVEGAVAALRPSEDLRVLFHDFYPLCPSYNLLTVRGTFCGLPERSACDACHGQLVLAGAGEAARPAPIPEWRARWYRLLERAAEIHVFAPSSRDLVLKVWPDLAPKLRLRPHSLKVAPRPIRRVEAAMRRARVPVVGVLGAIGEAKGAAVLHDLAEAAGDRLKIVVVGKVSSGYAHPNLRVHGDYDRRHISELAEEAGIDRWLIPSIWPETFSFTTHEALATGLPVYAFDLGAQADVLHAHPNGTVLPFEMTAEELATTLGAAPPKARRRRRKAVQGG